MSELNTAYSVINDVLEAVIGLIDALNPYAKVKIGSLPANDGISVYVASGAPEATFMTKSSAYELSLTLNGKHYSQKVVSNTLNNIHEALTQALSYPKNEHFQITNIETITTPEYLSREENKQYLYGSSLRVKFYYKKG